MNQRRKLSRSENYSHIGDSGIMNYTLIAALRKFTATIKDDPDYFENEGLFTSGECSSFAYILNKEFGYPLKAAYYYGDGNEDLVHIWAEQNGKAIDFYGVSRSTGKEFLVDYLENMSGFSVDWSVDNMHVEDISPQQAKEYVCSESLDEAKAWIEKYRKEYAITARKEG